MSAPPSGPRESGPRDDGFVQAVRDAVDLVDLARDYTQVEKRGARYKGLCPFHKEKTPSFSIDPERGLYYCFGCGAGGDAIRFHMQLTGDDFPLALESLARRFGVPIPERRGDTSGVQEQSRVLEAAAEFFVRQLDRHAAPLEYLRRRQVPSEAYRALGVGYAPDAWRELLGALQGRFSEQLLESAGLVARSAKSGRPYDRFRHRLVFPIHSTSGRLVGFGGRTLGDDPAKYVNTAETDSFRKSQLLYNLHRARPKIRESGRVLLVEGYFDVLGAQLCGIDWVVASMGTALTEQQAKLLSRYAGEVILGYDGDRAGEEASRKALRTPPRSGAAGRRARFPAGQDPDSLRLEEGPEAVRGYVDGAVDALELELARRGPETVADPRLRAAAAGELRELLEVVPDTVLRYSYGERAARHLGLPVEVFWRSRGASSAVRQGAAEPAEANVAPEARSSMEARILHLLLWLGRDALGARELPAADLFGDADCRELYRAFAAAVEADGMHGGDEQGPALDAALVQQGLPPASSAQGLLARLLAAPPEGVRDGEALTLLGTLAAKGALVRQRALQAELFAAQERGDADRVEQILAELAELRRRRHGARR